MPCGTPSSTPAPTPTRPPRALTPSRCEGAAMTTATLHPTFNAILAGVQAMPVQIARAQYVGRLAAFDWTHEQADDMSVVRRGRAELAELRKLREQLDPDHALWNRHAPEWMHTVTTVHTFKDFTGK